MLVSLPEFLDFELLFGEERVCVWYMSSLVTSSWTIHSRSGFSCSFSGFPDAYQQKKRTLMTLKLLAFPSGFSAQLTPRVHLPADAIGWE